MSRWGQRVALSAVLAMAGCSAGGTEPAHTALPPSSGSMRSEPAPPAGTAPAGRSAPAPAPSSGPSSGPALPPGGPVPAGFQPASVTFASASLGYVLGTTGACASTSCTSVLRTTDGGAHWAGVSAPRAGLAVYPASAASAPSVSRMRFADPRDGWAYGPGLWATHDGARSWHRLSLGGGVLSLEAAGGQVDAVTSTCAAGACRQITLLQSRVGSDDFRAVAAQRDAGSSNGALVLHPPTGFAALGTSTSKPEYGRPTALQATADGVAWRPFPDPCQVTRQLSLSSLALAGVRTLFTLCSGQGAAGSSDKQVVVTFNGHSAVAGSPGRRGDAGELAAATNSTLVVATSSAASWLVRSTDGGHRWATVAQYDDGGVGLTDLGFTTAMNGVVIHGRPTNGSTGPPQVDELLSTADAGSSWHHVTF